MSYKRVSEKENQERVKKFVKRYDIKKDSRGRLILYKAVKEDGSSGIYPYNHVTYVEGKYTSVKIVNHNINVSCGRGLHACPKNSAISFLRDYFYNTRGRCSRGAPRGKIIEIRVVPKDVVCVSNFTLASGYVCVHERKIRFKKCYVPRQKKED